MMKDTFNYLQIPEELFQEVALTGSSYICNPPVTDTDIDFVVYSQEWDKLHDWCEKNAFKTNFEAYEHEAFRSYKRGIINLIVTDDPLFYKRFVKATEVAKKLNLLNKQQRIDLFAFVLYESNIQA